MLLRKLLLKLKRKLFVRLTGLNPDDVRKLVYVQKYLEHNKRDCTYQEYLLEKKAKEIENKCNNKC